MISSLSDLRADPEAVSVEALKSALESLLFIATEPVEIRNLARAVGWPAISVRAALEDLSDDCRQRGLRVQWTGDSVQLATAPETARIIERFLGGDEKSSLSRGALETLAIIAFKQPVSRPTIDAMRGVNSDYMVGRLRERGLIEGVGREESAGRPLLYSTTFRFLEHFGLESLGDLQLPAPETLPEPEVEVDQGA